MPSKTNLLLQRITVHGTRQTLYALLQSRPQCRGRTGSSHNYGELFGHLVAEDQEVVHMTVEMRGAARSAVPEYGMEYVVATKRFRISCHPGNLHGLGTASTPAQLDKLVKARACSTPPQAAAPGTHGLAGGGGASAAAPAPAPPPAYATPASAAASEAPLAWLDDIAASSASLDDWLDGIVDYPDGEGSTDDNAVLHDATWRRDLEESGTRVFETNMMTGTLDTVFVAMGPRPTLRVRCSAPGRSEDVCLLLDSGAERTALLESTIRTLGVPGVEAHVTVQPASVKPSVGAPDPPRPTAQSHTFYPVDLAWGQRTCTVHACVVGDDCPLLGSDALAQLGVAVFATPAVDPAAPPAPNSTVSMRRLRVAMDDQGRPTVHPVSLPRHGALYPHLRNGTLREGAKLRTRYPNEKWGGAGGKAPVRGTLRADGRIATEHGAFSSPSAMAYFSNHIVHGCATTKYNGLSFVGVEQDGTVVALDAVSAPSRGRAGSDCWLPDLGHGTRLRARYKEHAWEGTVEVHGQAHTISTPRSGSYNSVGAFVTALRSHHGKTGRVSGPQHCEVWVPGQGWVALRAWREARGAEGGGASKKRRKA